MNDAIFLGVGRNLFDNLRLKMGVDNLCFTVANSF